MAGDKTKSIADLLPEVQPVTYQRNVIQKAVCELKFPTVYGLERGRPPVALASALRKPFPEHGMVDNLNVGIGGVAQDFAFVFKDKKGRTSVSLRPSALSIETSNYHSFEELLDTVLLVARVAKDVIDSDFFTRIGLRYINTLPYDQHRIADWVNPALVGPLGSGELGSPAEYSGRIVTSHDSGGFLLQHGLGKKGETDTEQYVLDFDVWREDVPFTDLQTVVEELHDIEFRLFHWSLGKATFEYMGPAKQKPGKRR